MLSAIPGVSALGAALSVPRKPQKSPRSPARKAAQATQRVGGLYQKAQGALAAFATKLSEMDRLYAEVARGETQLAAAQAVHATQCNRFQICMDS